MPFVLEKCMDFLQSHLPVQPDIFMLPSSDPAVQNLKASFEQKEPSQSTPSPISTDSSPQVVASCLLLYLQMLPHPLFPVGYYHTGIF